MKKVRIGMVGAGQVAYGNCRQALEHPQTELVAVADPSRKRARALKQEFDLGRTYASGKELYADPDVDAVSISVPNVFHAPEALAALAAGKHVLLDKPFAMNIREAKRVAAAAKQARRVFTVGMNQRFTPDAQAIKGLADRGDLGDLYHGKAYWFRRSGIPRFGTWFTRKDLAGGGALLDIGVHMLDLCLYLMDNFRPVAVSGATYGVFGPRGLGEGGWGMSDRGKHVFDVDDFSTALIKLRGGATVTLEVSWAIHQAEAGRHNVEVFGTEGGAAAYPAQVFRFGARDGEYEVVTPQGVRGPYTGANRYTNWVDAILRKAKPCGTLPQALAVQQILDAIYASARTGKEVRIK